MIQLRSLLKVTDNSGAKEVRVISVLGQPSATGGQIGDIIIGSVRKRLPNSEISKGAVVRGVIVRTRNGYRREDGSTIRFDDNAIVLVTPNLEPVGTRIFGPVPRELRQKRMLRILSLAPEVL
ncbi:MAG TPA: 50S ribosomal protein L14 [Candidatus Fraserbacteria bacterium]|nr:50S ribosomal protein L14 [Candidatus Fraserbacteria bacterium]